MDTLTKKTRSKIMSAIRSRNNRTTEKRLRYALVSHGIHGWKLNVRSLPGCPDFVFCKKKIVIFVDGCFWHRCPRCFRKPKSSLQYWNKKIKSNQERDQRVRQRLNRHGWKVVRIRECDLKYSIAACVDKIRKAVLLK